jgi:hypothetical protein
MYRYTKQGDRKQITAKVKPAQWGRLTGGQVEVINSNCVEVAIGSGRATVLPETWLGNA